jgi:hypothetical protein
MQQCRLVFSMSGNVWDIEYDVQQNSFLYLRRETFRLNLETNIFTMNKHCTNHVARRVNLRFAKFGYKSQCYVIPFFRFVIWEVIGDNEGRVNVVDEVLLRTGGG